MGAGAIHETVGSGSHEKETPPPPVLHERPKETRVVRQLPETEHCHKQRSGCGFQTCGINYPEGLQTLDPSPINDSVILRQTQGYILISPAQVMISLPF